MLRDIQIEMEYNSMEVDRYKIFNSGTAIISDFLLRLMGKINIGKIKKFVIECTEQNTVKKNNFGDDAGAVEIFRKKIILNDYFNLTEVDKKKFLLSLLIEGFKELHKHYTFSLEKIIEAEKEIQNLKYENHYHYGKQIKSPHKQLSAVFWIEHEINDFLIYVDILDKENNLMKRELIKKVFPNWVGYSAYLGNLKWENNALVHIFDSKNKPLKKIKV